MSQSNDIQTIRNMNRICLIFRHIFLDAEFHWTRSYANAAAAMLIEQFLMPKSLCFTTSAPLCMHLRISMTIPHWNHRAQSKSDRDRISHSSRQRNDDKTSNRNKTKFPITCEYVLKVNADGWWLMVADFCAIVGMFEWDSLLGWCEPLCVCVCTMFVSLIITH